MVPSCFMVTEYPYQYFSTTYLNLHHNSIQENESDIGT